MTEHSYAHKLKQGAPPSFAPKPQAASVAHHATASGGKALDTQTQRQMGPRFGHDFSQVRIHTDTHAAESARALGANAYAVGNNIVFGPGHYAPGTREGDRLLAHEMTHVVQQAKHGTGDTSLTSQKEDASEQEAEALASQVVQGRTVEVQALPQAAIARDDDDAFDSSIHQKLSDQWKLHLDDQGAGLGYNQGPFNGRFGMSSPDNPGVSGSLGLGAPLQPFPFYHPDPKDDPFHLPPTPMPSPGPSGDGKESSSWGLRGDGFYGSDGSWGVGGSLGFQF